MAFDPLLTVYVAFWQFYCQSRAAAWNEVWPVGNPKYPISPKHFTAKLPNHSGLFCVYMSFTTYILLNWIQGITKIILKAFRHFFLGSWSFLPCISIACLWSCSRSLLWPNFSYPSIHQFSNCLASIIDLSTYPSIINQSFIDIYLSSIYLSSIYISLLIIILFFLLSCGCFQGGRSGGHTLPNF